MKPRKITCCIYIIKNIVNNKLYIGCAIDFISRKWRHSTDLRNNKHHNIHLQRAWNEYGESNFSFEILEEYIKRVNAYDDYVE